MILRLNGADFSANNIGHIDIIREISEETNTLLSKFSKNFTEEQKFAVQDFIAGLKTNDIWSCIGNLYIPAMAGSLAECGINVKSGISDLALGSADYVFDNGGLKLIPTTSNYWSTASKIKVNGSQQNLHLGAYNLDSYSGMTQTDIIFGRDITIDGIKSIIQFGITNNGAFSAKTDGNNMISLPTSNRAGWEKPSLKMLVQSTLGNFGMLNGTANDYGTPIATDNTYTNAEVNLFNIASIWRNTYSRYGLLTLGNAMTREQAEKYNELCTVLISALIS